MVTQYFWPENFRINELVSELVRDGYHVDVITGRPNYPGGSIFQEYKDCPSKFSDYHGAKVYRVIGPPRGRYKWSLAFSYLFFPIITTFYGLIFLRKSQYTSILAVQLSPIFSVIPALVFSRLWKVPLSIWVLDLWPEILVALNKVKNRGFTHRFIRFLSDGIYKAADLLLVTSNGFAHELSKRGIAMEKIVYFPQWVEAFKGPPAAVSIKRLEAQLSIHERTFKIVFTGNIGECQDFPSVIKAFGEVDQKSNVTLFVVGTGRAESEARELVRRSGLSDNIIFLGWFPPEYMTFFYDFADALLLPLADDALFRITIPGKTQSYLSAGKPIIGMLSGEGADVLKKSGAALVAPAGDWSSLASCIKKIINYPEEHRISMGLSGRKISHEEFSLEKAISSFASHH